MAAFCSATSTRRSLRRWSGWLTTVEAASGADQRRAVIDLQQAAGYRDAPLREDHQRVAVLDRLNDSPRRERPGGIEWPRARQLNERPHPPTFGELVINREDRLLAEDRKRHLQAFAAGLVSAGLRLIPARPERRTARSCQARAGRHRAGGANPQRRARRSRRRLLPLRHRRPAARDPAHKALSHMNNCNGPLRIGIGGPVGTARQR